MKLSKKKKIIIIIATVVVIAAIATAIGVTCSKKTKGSDSAENQTVTVAVTDENGNTVTNANGQAVTQTQTVTKNPNSPSPSSKNKDNKGNDNNNSNSNSKDKNETTTQYTTNSALDANSGYDQPLDDDVVLTAKNGLLALQEYYGDEYVVNYNEKNSASGTFTYYIFEKGKNNSTIVYTVTAEEKTGKAIQVDKKGKSKDITEELKKFYW